MPRLLAALLLALWTLPAAAQEVTLTAPGLSLTGRLLGFDGRTYALDTGAGEVSVDGRAATCAGEACPDPAAPPLWRLSGDPRLATVVLPALLDGFAAAAGGATRTAADGSTEVLDGAGAVTLRVRLRPASSGEAVADLVAGEVDGALMAQSPTPAEAEALARAGRVTGPPRLRLLGRDALVAATGRGQSVTRLTAGALAGVLSGAVTDWAELGGAPGPIRLHLGPPGAAGEGALALLAPDAATPEGAIRHSDEAALAAALAADPQGFGLLPFERAGEARPMALVGACGLASVPRAEAVRAGDYPLTLPLALLLPSRRQAPAVEAVLAFLASPQAQLTLRRAGLVGTEPVPIPLAEQGDRLAAAIAAAGTEVRLRDLQAMLARLAPFTRLSTTFRSDLAGGLDAASRALVLQLAGEVAAGRWDGRTLLLAGFADGAGPAAEGRERSRAAARAAAAALRAALGGPWPAAVGLETEGFGEALPMACDGDPWGAAVNDRVEVWAG